jgi:hypothetical protein
LQGRGERGQRGAEREGVERGRKTMREGREGDKCLDERRQGRTVSKEP